ncbi:Nicotinamide/nicotinic acid mononucleotide adenylyltransferase 1, partial [Coemansia sp. RSA 1591]
MGEPITDGIQRRSSEDNGTGASTQGTPPPGYSFPTNKLAKTMQEMAADYFNGHQKYELIGGYFSPVSDYYQKEGLAPAHHRVQMCELATETSSTWLMVDSWEALQHSYQRTA